MGDDNRQLIGPDGCDFALTDATIDRLSSKPVTKQVEIFSTIGSETRYRILLFLIEADDPICGCEIEPHFDVSQSTVSQSLNRLRKAGLVRRTKEGRWRYYEPTRMAERLVEQIETPLDSELATVD